MPVRGRVAERLLKRDETLLRRVCWLFVLFNGLLAVTSLVELTYDDAPGWPRSGVMAAAFIGLGVWAVAYFQADGRSRLLEAGPFVLLLVGGTAAGDLEFIFSRLFVALFLHSLYRPGRLRLLTLGAAYIATYTAVGALIGTPVDGPNLITLVLSVYVVIFIMQTVSATMSRHQILSDRDATLTQVTGDLLAERDPERIFQIVAEGVLRLGHEPGAAATVWRGEGDHLQLVAAAGEEPAPVEQASLPALPPELSQIYLDGRTVAVGPDEMAVIKERYGFDNDQISAVVATVVAAGAPRWLLVIASTRQLDADLTEVLRRFAHEVSLALQLAEREALLTGIVEGSSDLIAVVDPEGSLSFLSPAVAELTGAGPQQLLGRPLATLLCAPETGEPLDVGALGLRTPTPLRLLDRGGVREVEVTCNALGDGSRVLNIRDVSERRRLEEEITYRAFHDSVTGLPNRALFLDRLDQAARRAERDERPFAVVLLDLDDFKGVNDRLGHAAGDELLVRVARRLEEATRGSDTAARFGGDEFALLLDGFDDADQATAIVDRVLGRVREPLELEGREIVTTASAGVVVCEQPVDSDEVLRNADAAMYAVKSTGKSRYAVFEPEMHARVLAGVELRGELELALARDELVVHYQPMVDLSTEQVLGYEALLRWEHPTRGLLGPGEFIAAAEETGLIVPIGRWVLAEACAQLAAWGADEPDPPTMAVNLSPVQLRASGLVADVASALRHSGIAPHRLTLEITETALMGDAEEAAAVLRELRALGVRIAIDDFGTGYSSFSHLQRFAVDIIKVDRAFVSVIEQGPEQSALAEAIVKLADALGLETVAEGVEQRGEAEALRGWGCDHAQGWLWWRAMPVHQLPASRLAARPTAQLR